MMRILVDLVFMAFFAILLWCCPKVPTRDRAVPWALFIVFTVFLVFDIVRWLVTPA